MLLWNDALTAEAERTLAAMRTALEAEDGERAVDLGWQALAMEPLRPERYFLLATVSDETGGMPELGRQLRALGLEAMLAQGRIGEAQRMTLARAFPNWRGDWGDTERIEEEADKLRMGIGVELEVEGVVWDALGHGYLPPLRLRVGRPLVLRVFWVISLATRRGMAVDLPSRTA